jgi:hypothetical protein
VFGDRFSCDVMIFHERRQREIDFQSEESFSMDEARAHGFLGPATVFQERHASG